MTISERVAYLKGLAEGLDIKESKEGKLISVIAEILEEIGLSIEDLEENNVLLGEELDAISDDLSDVEDVLFEEDDEENEEDFFAIDCPNCGEDLDIDSDALREGAVTCGACEQTFAIDCDCDCGCDCDDEDDGECCGCGCEKDEE